MAKKRKHKKLNDYQHVRLRTEMYLGSRELHTQTVVHYDGERLASKEFTWVPALYTALRELIDNALDEVIGHKHGTTIRVTYDEEKMEFSVEDNGHGLPIRENAALGKGPAASILLGQLRAGSNFDDEERGRVAGVNGLGAACTNYTSEWFKLDVWQSGKHFHQQWKEGTYRGVDTLKATEPKIKRGDAQRNRKGTRIRYKPSSKVFPKLILPTEFVEGRLWDIAVVNPKLKLYFNGKRLTPKKGRDPIIATYFEDRPVGLMEVSGNASGRDFHGKYYLSPNFSENGEVIHSVVNNLPAYEGGAHIEAFRELFYPAMMEELRKKAKKEKLKLIRSDISTGLLIFNITHMSAPMFDSQTKARLISEVRVAVKEGWDSWQIGSLVRRNPDWVEEILERCRERTAAKETREVNQKQRKLSRTKIAKLRDATGRDRSKCILFITEGDSATNKLCDVRDPAIQGAFPLTGKILNVHDVSPKKVLANKVLANLMISIGLQIGEKAHRDSLRYGAVFIAADEDEDGKNIVAQLVNFFFTFWPELFQDPKHPFFYKFSTPFIKAEKGKQTKYFYAHDYEDFQKNLNRYKGWAITRAKGLGSLKEKDWERALESPVIIPLVDDGNLQETLDLIFNGERADDRKEWLSK